MKSRDPLRGIRQSETAPASPPRVPAEAQRTGGIKLWQCRHIAPAAQPTR